MILKDLFEDNPISFIDEDNTFIGNQPLEKQDVSFDVAYSRPIGTFNSLEIWGSRYLGKNRDLYGILDTKREILAWCIFDTQKHPGYSTLTRTYVDAQHRGQNLTLVIINFLVEKAKEKIMIDKEELTSDSSRGMIKSWYKNPQKRRFDMKFFKNKELIEKPDLAEILKPGHKNEISITLESISKITPPRYGAGKRIIMDWIW